MHSGSGFVHYPFFNMGQVKLSMDKYLMAIYLSLGKYKFFAIFTSIKLE